MYGQGQVQLRTMDTIFGFALSVLLMGCQESTTSTPPESTSDPAEVVTTSTGEMLYLEPDELAEQMALAKQGDNHAARRVAYHYGFGEAKPKQAYPWLTMAAQRGDIAAMRTLSTYLSGDGGQENCQQALQWLERAKREGSPEEVKRHAVDDAISNLKANACAQRPSS